ncbi:DEAD/DEAH box helicase [Candidatus Poribacteria bacterium]|nr:DEAD/DEAH box helicase [Candidatus Poribacteria bacterium]
MPNINLKPTHKPVKEYYNTLQQYATQNITHEGAVRTAFLALLTTCAKQRNATLITEYPMTTDEGKNIFIDGAITTEFEDPIAYWEAKDIDDDLQKAVQDKRNAGYPMDNILFQTPEKAILVQNGQVVMKEIDITVPTNLVNALQRLFAYTPPSAEEWQRAVNDFRERVPDLANKLKELIEERINTDTNFIEAFNAFYDICRTAINPDLSRDAVEEMLVQHILTERIFRTVFDRSDFTRRNIIANEIEKVSDALMQHAVSRDVFLRDVDHFYVAIERAARLYRDFSKKQHFLNTLYEQFFQSFSEDVADTHGIVYTPQPIVDFMVNSVSHILETEFGRSLSDTGVHIIDPFVGTGNFIVRLMRDIQGTALEAKYRDELHCNEVMLLPYYIASLNIEQEYYQRTQTYLPFEGIALADTFELLEDRQYPLFTKENTERVEKQKGTDMFVVIGNPPYNMGQVNEMDNNKNRPYETMDERVADTYVADSTATLRNKLSDPYVKAIRWASDRIGQEGVVAFVTNNSFLDGIAFDGMRKHLYQDFNRIYILDLKGDVRKDSMREGIPIGEKHTVFGLAAMVGITVTFFVKSQHHHDHKIYYSEVDWKATRQEKFNLVENASSINGIEWNEITPDKKNTWLTEGLQNDFTTLVPMRSRISKDAATNVTFKTYSLGVSTNRDTWAYNFNQNELTKNIKQMIETYNSEIDRWNRREDRTVKVDDFVLSDETSIKWSSGLKNKLKSGKTAHFLQEKIRTSLYRPFSKMNLYFDPRMMTERAALFPSIYPTPETERENYVICVKGISGSKPFHTLMVDVIPDLHLTGDSQCFPFYTYDEDGTNRKENITDWALTQFQEHYNDTTITKWDIFHYTYALLHHPDYRQKYEMNLKRDLPHIPYAPDFRAFADAGAQLADIHVNYETQPIYDGLQHIETPDVPIDFRVEKMQLSKDKTQLKYNDFLTISGIPSAVYDYRLGTRSALEWIIDQYRVKTDKRSGIVNDPNRPDDPRYIIDLIGRVITVSLHTVNIIETLPPLESAHSTSL